jgi:hypothetical protein
VSQSIESLTTAGLINADAEDGFSYMPANQATAELMERAEQLYHSRPDHVRRLIVSRETSSLTAFANAFRLRDD